MNHCGAEAEQPLTVAGSGSGPSRSSSGSPSSWPPPTGSTSFFRQLFAEDDDSAVAVAAGDSSSYAVDDLLLPAAATVPTAFDDDVSADPVFQLGAFPMVDNFMNTRVPLMGQGDHTPPSGHPHTLEFVTPPYSGSGASRLPDADQGHDTRYRSKCNLRLDHIGGGDQELLAKKPKLQPADEQCSSGGTAVDPSQLQSIINKVNQSQSARSKEKLGERINALQQLVSPFGKTDTASVLSEAIGYIKFLQEQVQVLSSPYMKPTSTLTGGSRQDIGAESTLSDLRSRGLCLVPVSCTKTVANNNNFNIGADYWASTPNLSGSTGSGASTARFSAST